MPPRLVSLFVVPVFEFQGPYLLLFERIGCRSRVAVDENNRRLAWGRTTIVASTRVVRSGHRVRAL